MTHRSSPARVRFVLLAIQILVVFACVEKINQIQIQAGKSLACSQSVLSLVSMKAHRSLWREACRGFAVAHHFLGWCLWRGLRSGLQSKTDFIRQTLTVMASALESYVNRILFA